MVVECGEGSGKGEKEIQVVVDSHDKERNIVLPPFTVSFVKEGDELSFLLTRQITSFVLYPAGKSRFVKNGQLSKVI